MVNKVKFDRERVVNLACKLFWQKGYHATSTRDLQEAVDMRPGSIYATFGSKQGLFAEALNCYASDMCERLNRCLLGSDSILLGLECFVREIVLSERGDQPSDICMLIKSSAEFTTEEPSLLALSQALLADFETHLSGLFQKAQAQGELSKALQPVDYARNFQIQFTGLRNYLNRSDDLSLADRLITQTFRSLQQL